MRFDGAEGTASGPAREPAPPSGVGDNGTARCLQRTFQEESRPHVDATHRSGIAGTTYTPSPCCARSSRKARSCRTSIGGSAASAVGQNCGSDANARISPVHRALGIGRPLVQPEQRSVVRTIQAAVEPVVKQLEVERARSGFLFEDHAEQLTPALISAVGRAAREGAGKALKTRRMQHGADRRQRRIDASMQGHYRRPRPGA
jgi:hypothetical protein